MRNRLLNRLLVFHPFLFAIFPVLFLFAYNIDEVPAIDLLLPVIVVVALTFILLFSLRLVTKSYNKIAIITSLFLILFFSYGHVRGLFPRGNITSLPINIFLTLLWVALSAIGGFFIIKSRKDFSFCSKYLNIVAITLVIISIINIGIYEIKSINLGYEEEKQEDGDSGLQKVGNLPDIYYIILDGYSRADVLQEDFNYDNGKFIKYLTDRGFYVATRSRSNYSSTSFSLPCSLNMDYFEKRESSATRLEMTRNSKVSRILQQIGYRYIFIGGNRAIKDIDKYADSYLYKEVFGIRANPFMHSLCDTTLLSPFSRFFSSHGANSILYAFNTLADIPNIGEPTFVYAHVKCPHPPWLFDSNGPKEFKIFESGYESGEVCREGYLGNLVFINKKVKALVNEILLKSDIPPVIILQGDHGIDFSEEGGMLYHHEILNAYYLPGKDSRLLSETVTPVNSFRIVFNLYFGTDYELLKDESYVANYEHPHGFIPFPPENDAD